ncbi:hypothetical protein Q4E93_10570 [Flavitalea sp. BT771]|uniref:DUF3108 domain-containing protein n=1 Tax=Flavitalea sp. BT771 TaxID=3063329 RepID=UPI0026E32325|nr:hypothetical protein [Flavitalea sp. BT771]MDO6431033.1 hypothetical protein [Flavitalea sp. BT771]MDV6219940.1 hypothetical protein [Flavitalea sp. BT771]
MRTFIYISLLLIHLLVAAISRGQVGQADTIRPGEGHLLTTVLKPGLRQYLVYYQYPQKADRLGFWYWMRDIAMEDKGGKRYFAITQHWYGGDSASYRKVYSLNSVTDFAPVYHCETVRGKIAAYDWSGENIKGADTVADNDKKSFNLRFSEPNFNWNLDIETFEMLPLAAGKSFLINFYDAGAAPPKYLLYRVTGSEALTLMNGEKMDCWKLFTEGESPRGPYTQTFWISKETHEFLKEEDAFGGNYRYKVKMPGTAPDLLSRFATKD